MNPKGRMTIPSPRCIIVKREERKTTVRETTEILRKGAEAEQKANFSIAAARRWAVSSNARCYLSSEWATQRHHEEWKSFPLSLPLQVWHLVRYPPGSVRSGEHAGLELHRPGSHWHACAKENQRYWRIGRAGRRAEGRKAQGEGTRRSNRSLGDRQNTCKSLPNGLPTFFIRGSYSLLKRAIRS